MGTDEGADENSVLELEDSGEEDAEEKAASTLVLEPEDDTGEIPASEFGEGGEESSPENNTSDDEETAV
jgi:hypothetical protein